MAELCRAQGNYAAAESLFKQALEIGKEALGELHPEYARWLNNLAMVYRQQGEYDRAELFYRQSLEIVKRTLGEADTMYASVLNNLAALYRVRGDLARVEPLLQKAMVIYKKAFGESSAAYATSLNNLAMVRSEQGDYAGAEPLFRQALEIEGKILREGDPAHATTLNNLGVLYFRLGEHTRAGALYRRALEIDKKELGESHPDYAVDLNNLALNYLAMGDYELAEPLCRQAMEIRKKVWGEAHPAYAAGLNNLAEIYRAMGDYAKAEPLFRQALEIFKRALGEQHPDYASSLSNLANLYQDMGDYPKAEPLMGHSVEISRCNLELAAAVQSERQQLAMTHQLRKFLDYYVALAPLAKKNAEASYRPVLAWKGAVLARQQRLRLDAQRPELATDFARLRQVTSQLAALALAVPAPKQRAASHEQIQKLTEEKERLESGLAGRSAEFRQQQALARLTPVELQKVLPQDTVLIDFLQYGSRSRPPQGKGKWTTERRLVAFVVRPEAIVRVDLGPVEPVAAAIKAWRENFGAGGPGEGSSPGVELRRRVWAPLEPHLNGAKTVLVSPDGVLGRFPWAALPGKQPGTYLLEERAVAVVPVPQLLPELLAKPAGPRGDPSLLLVGEVNFDAAPGAARTVATTRSAPRGNQDSELRKWRHLPSTRVEILALRDSFEQRFPNAAVQVLRQGRATEDEVRKQAPRHRYLHLATHGFFDPPGLRSVLAPSRGDDVNALFGREGVVGFHPGLLSGLVLAGANQPTDPEQDDGILTALEIAALDLTGVELATLSACDTGLGEIVGGEGLLGLQRAFQVAGAKSVVASLWKVDDAATGLLMQRFYENLWHAKERKGKLEALREAQLYMLQHGVERGLVRVQNQGETTKPTRTSPYFWAAFVLSGDWR